jgi:hypothetical protein
MNGEAVALISIIGLVLFFSAIWPVVRFFSHPDKIKCSQGWGLRHLGRADYKEDGSYVSTVWLVIFFIPILPLRSQRIRDIDTRQGSSHGELITRYEIIETVSLRFTQIALVYFAAIIFIAYCVAVVYALILGPISRGEDPGFLAFLRMIATIPLILGPAFLVPHYFDKLVRMRCLKKLGGGWRV